MLERFYKGVIKYRKIIFAVFILAAIAGALMKPLVGVNHDMKDYLPEDTPSTQALNVMQEEFDGDIPNARVMVKNVTYAEALAYKNQLEDVDGVEEVTWLDDSSLLSDVPVEFADKDDLDTYYVLDKDGRTGDALMTVTIDKEKRQINTKRSKSRRQYIFRDQLFAPDQINHRHHCKNQRDKNPDLQYAGHPGDRHRDRDQSDSRKDHDLKPPLQPDRQCRSNRKYCQNSHKYTSSV